MIVEAIRRCKLMSSEMHIKVDQSERERRYLSSFCGTGKTTDDYGRKTLNYPLCPGQTDCLSSRSDTFDEV